MIDTVRSIEVRVGPEVVWSVLAEFDAISGWAPNVDHSCHLSGPADGVGAIRRIQAGRTTLIETVTVWEEPRDLAYTIEGLPPVVRSVTSSWRIDPSMSGSQVSLTSRVDTGPRPPQKLIARLIARKLAQASDQMLAGLAARIAATPADPQGRHP